ncbi:MAG: hypothetical protein QOF91_2818 [Alphaproteobacteria bacterium]|jgi:hypothetical protein|nr:hypothetical protein [Alphaproteobacteria bacterium]
MARIIWELRSAVDTFEWIETVRTIESMDIRYTMPGHGKIYTIAEARTFRQQMEELVHQVEKCIEPSAGRQLSAEIPRLHLQRFDMQVRARTCHLA